MDARSVYLAIIPSKFKNRVSIYGYASVKGQYRIAVEGKVKALKVGNKVPEIYRRLRIISIPEKNNILWRGVIICLTQLEPDFLHDL